MNKDKTMTPANPRPSETQRGAGTGKGTGAPVSHCKSGTLSRPCTRYHRIEFCQQENDCQYPHKELWKPTISQRNKVGDAMMTVNAKLERPP